MNFKNLVSGVGKVADKISQGIEKLDQKFQAQEPVSDEPGPTFMTVGQRRLRVVKKLAEGGYGFVFHVTDTATSEDFALKKVVI